MSSPNSDTAAIVPDMPKPGRPPKAATAKGTTTLRFIATPVLANELRKRAEADGRDLGTFLRHTICVALGIKPPVSRKWKTGAKS